ncbi:hypothetical protein DRQ50_13920 [bacterium]|nr:MAG: hypothetical protein DRQ50_13920 [bacterium]
MFTMDAFDIFGSLPVSLAFWLFVAVILLYLARLPAHRAFRATGRAIHNGLRLTARSLVLAEQSLSRRNREVLFNAGAEAAEYDLDREFDRIGKTVERDVSQLPGLQRELAEQITHLDEDYRASSVVPPSPPGWVAAVEAVADLSRHGDAPVASILKEIHRSTAAQHDESLAAYRDAVAERHARLDRMLPRWRSVGNALDRTCKKAVILLQRSQTVDKQIALYKEIRAGSDAAERELTSSSLTQFFIAGLALVIAVGGAVINFNLIALPMSEMVGGGSYIGNWKTSDVAALVIILVEVAMGLYLMESLRITRLFPVIGQMDDRTRVRMAWVTFSILLVLAGIESSLALMRDRIAADMMALRHSLAAVEPMATPTSMIPTIGQMVMGFILPFALTFVAIPLETFVSSSRNVLGAGLALLLRATAFTLRLLGNAAGATSELLVNLYDVVIFLPLWLDRQWHGRRSGTVAQPIKAPDVEPGWDHLPVVAPSNDPEKDLHEEEVLT